MLRGRKKRVVGRRLQRVVVSDVVYLRIGARVMTLVCLARLGGVVPAHVTRKRRRSRRLVCDLAGMGVAVTSELGASRVASVTLATARVSSIGRSRRAVVVLLRRMQRVIGRVLRRVVLRDGGELDFRIAAPVMAVIRWS